MLCDPALAEDVAQETLLRAWERREAFVADRDPAPWLYTVARNLCIEALRARARMVSVSELPDVPRDDADPIDAIDEISLLRKALADMPERQREMLLLKDANRVGYPALAQHLGVSEPTARVLLFRARKHLRERYAAAAGAIAMLWGAIRGGVLQRARKANMWIQTASSANGVIANTAIGIVIASSLATPHPRDAARTSVASVVVVSSRTDAVAGSTARPLTTNAGAAATVRPAPAVRVDPVHGADIQTPVPSSDGNDGRAWARTWRDRHASDSILLGTAEHICGATCPLAEFRGES